MISNESSVYLKLIKNIYKYISSISSKGYKSGVWIGMDQGCGSPIRVRHPFGDKAAHGKLFGNYSALNS
jgi:hypothetical protein